MNQLKPEQLDFLHQQLQLGHSVYIPGVGWAPAEAEWTPPNPTGTDRMRGMETRIKPSTSGLFAVESSFIEDVERWRMPQDYVARCVLPWDKIQAMIARRLHSMDQLRIEREH